MVVPLRKGVRALCCNLLLTHFICANNLGCSTYTFREMVEAAQSLFHCGNKKLRQHQQRGLSANLRAT